MIAREAGVSVNLIQHYFGTKDQLLVAALELLGRGAVERIRARTAALGDEPSERALLGAIFAALFPDDEVSRTTMLLFIVFEAAALSHTGLARAEARQMTSSLFAAVADLLRRAQAAGRAPTSIDPDREAVVLTSTLTSVSQAWWPGTSRSTTDAPPSPTRWTGPCRSVARRSRGRGVRAASARVAPAC